MLIRLDMASATPIYVQLRNQIVMGIGTGALKVGEKLPTVRQMAADAGVSLHNRYVELFLQTLYF